MDHRKEWRTAERLLKQGNVAGALEQLRKVTAAAAEDVLTLNRLGDLLAREGRHAEAISYYVQIADTYEKSGFVPKAIAIHRKILRLDPDHLASAIRLGTLYGRQQMHGEARKYLLHAANRHLECGELASAREVFERLVEAEPDDQRHRVRLAEARAAEGDAAQAVVELANVGDVLLARGETLEAEKIFERAQELDPEGEHALVGLARCREAAGRPEQAIEALEKLVAGRAGTASALAELARLYETSGRARDALGLIATAPLLEIAPTAWRRLFAAALQHGNTEEFWKALDRKIDALSRPEQQAGIATILGQIAELEPEGHIPALQRLAALHEAGGHVQRTVQALDALARAYRARSMHGEAASTLERMRRAAPPDEEPQQAVAVAASTATLIEPTSLVEESRTAVSAPATDPEAPPVPLTRADQEFVSGRVTQAEVLEKYDLVPQALQQIEEVLGRFPGHIGAQQRRVQLLRGSAEEERLPQALCELALARRAAGELVEAREAAREAVSHDSLPAASRRMLEALMLVGEVVESGAEPTLPAAERETRVVDSHGMPAERRASREVVIDLDDEPTDPPEVVAPSAALRDAAWPVEEAAGEAEDDLTAIKAALEQELLEVDAESIIPEESPDQSVSEVLRAFRQRVDEEVGGDLRMHYDLGIGYKEMGLLDEAIDAFGKAARSSELRREACAMLAICHRERQEAQEAVRWYRAALEGEHEDLGMAQRLRYDLAETLLEAGDAAAALRQFRDVLEIDPSFRDVRGRVSDLETSLQS